MRERRPPKRYGFDGTGSELYLNQVEHVMGLINKNSFSPILPVAYYDMLELLCVGVPD